MNGITYDTGALVAAERDDRRMWALHAGYLAEGVVPVVPAGVLAEAWRGGARQTRLVQLLAMCEVEDLTQTQARAVGALAAAARHDDVVDVSVVEGAARRGDGIVTADPRDIGAIARGARARVLITSV